MRDSCAGYGFFILAVVSFGWACFLASVWRSGYRTGEACGYDAARRATLAFLDKRPNARGLCVRFIPGLIEFLETDAP